MFLVYYNYNDNECKMTNSNNPSIQFIVPTRYTNHSQHRPFGTKLGTKQTGVIEMRVFG